MGDYTHVQTKIYLGFLSSRRRIAEKGSSPEPDQRSVSIIGDAPSLTCVMSTFHVIRFQNISAYGSPPSCLITDTLSSVCPDCTTFMTFLSEISHSVAHCFICVIACVSCVDIMQHTPFGTVSSFTELHTNGHLTSCNNRVFNVFNCILICVFSGLLLFCVHTTCPSCLLNVVINVCCCEPSAGRADHLFLSALHFEKSPVR